MVEITEKCREKEKAVCEGLIYASILKASLAIPL